MKTYRLLFLDLDLPYLLKDVGHPVGGACVRQYALAKGIVALGHKVGILTWKGAESYIQKEVEFDIVESLALSKGDQKLRWIYHIYPALYKAIKSYQPDIVFQKCSGLITGVLAFISKRLDIPFVYIAANDIDTDGRYRDRLRYIDIKLYEYGIKNAEQLIVQNSYQRKAFHNKWKEKRITIIHNPFYYEGKLPEIKPLKERTYVTWIGLFEYQKNLPALLNIIMKSPDIEFRIAGTFTDTCPSYVKKVVEEIADCSNVKMVGYIRRKEIITFLANAFVLLNTSHYEGFSNTFLESFAAGTPVISTRIDPDNIITTNGLGIVTENYEEVPKRLNEMIYKSDYNEMAEKCRNYVLENHDAKIIAETFLESLSND